MAPLIRPAALVLICSIPRVAYAQPTLTANDFQCFIQRFVAGDPYADCDLSGQNQNTGWTTLTLPPGNRTWAVAANGTSYGLGTESSPLDTPQRAIDRAAPGDFIVIRCNDQWVNLPQLNVTKSVTITTYGAGPAPLLGFTMTGVYVNNVQNVRIVGLEIAGENVNNTSGIIALQNVSGLLVEGCIIRNYRDGVVVHDFGTGVRITGVKLRRSVVADSWFPNSPLDPNGNPIGRSEGVYFGNLDGWLIEECGLDRNGIVGSMFSRNAYIHETCGPGDFIGNITARSASEGIQQRPGGRMLNNLGLSCSYDFYHGGPGEVAHNVAIDSRNINTTDRRGTGFLIDGLTSVRFNIVGYNTGGSGWGSVRAFEFRGLTGLVEGNFAYSWPDPVQHESQCYFFKNGGVATVRNNTAIQPESGWCFEWTGATVNNGGGNRYWFVGTAPRDMSATLGATRFTTAPVNPRFTVADYMVAIGETPATLDGFMARVREQSRQTWDQRFTAAAFNAWARQKCGLAPMP